MSIFKEQDLRFLLDTHGKDLTLTLVSAGGTYNPSTGGITGKTTTAYTVKGFFYNYSVDEMQSSSVVYGDRKLVLGIYDTSYVAIPVPTVGGTLSGEGDTVNIVSVDKIMSGNNPVCYICQVRE